MKHLQYFIYLVTCEVMSSYGVVFSVVEHLVNAQQDTMYSSLKMRIFQHVQHAARLVEYVEICGGNGIKSHRQCWCLDIVRKWWYGHLFFIINVLYFYCTFERARSLKIPGFLVSFIWFLIFSKLRATSFEAYIGLFTITEPGLKHVDMTGVMNDEQPW